MLINVKRGSLWVNLFFLIMVFLARSFRIIFLVTAVSGYAVS